MVLSTLGWAEEVFGYRPYSPSPWASKLACLGRPFASGDPWPPAAVLRGEDPGSRPGRVGAPGAGYLRAPPLPGSRGSTGYGGREDEEPRDWGREGLGTRGPAGALGPSLRFRALCPAPLLLFVRRELPATVVPAVVPKVNRRITQCSVRLSF